MSGKSLELSNSFESLEEPIQKWIWLQGWSSLREIQANSIPIVLKGDSDVIISATTAGGKTEAAFLPILSALLKAPNNVGYQVLYISPLKALINDQYRRLLDMTSEMKIEVTAWHGDINNHRKTKSLKDPKGVVIITPESLEALLINRTQYTLKAFSSLRYIVIDELHSFIGTERGKQLQSLLSRVEYIAGRVIPRVAMSATFSDYESVKNFLRADNALPCRVPEQGETSHEVKILIKEYLPTDTYDPSDDMVNELYAKLRGSNNLIFANSKVLVEQFAVALSDMSSVNGVPNEFRVHHGSLSKNERESVERELQKGDFPITAACTSTLELGVDIGKVKSIAQIGTSYSVAGLRQRLGRSGRRDEPSILRILSTENLNNALFYDLRVNLVHNIAVVELLRDKQYETPSVNNFYFSTLIQQILSILAQYGEFNPKDGWSMLCANGAFRNVTPKIFLELLQALGAKDIIASLHSGQIVIGKAGERIVGSRDFYTAFTTPIEFNVINKHTSKRLGVVEVIPEIGVMILISGRRWLVESVDASGKTIYVINVQSGGSAMFGGDYAEVDKIIPEKMRAVFESDTVYPYLDASTKSDKQLESARAFYRSHKLNRRVFFSYGSKSVFVTWAGAKINRTVVLITKCYLGKNASSDYLMVWGVTVNDLLAMKERGKPSLEYLAKSVKRVGKERQKYDYLLSDRLLNLEYSTTYLDIDEAWKLIEQYS